MTLLVIHAHISVAAPLKGIPKAPFRSPTNPSMFSPPSNRTPIPPARTPLRKERGVKVTIVRMIGDLHVPNVWNGTSPCLMNHLLPFQLLDISELDMVGAGREAKRRRKTLGRFCFFLHLFLFLFFNCLSLPLVALFPLPPSFPFFPSYCCWPLDFAGPVCFPS